MVVQPAAQSPFFFTEADEDLVGVGNVVGIASKNEGGSRHPRQFKFGEREDESLFLGYGADEIYGPAVTVGSCECDDSGDTSSDEGHKDLLFDLGGEAAKRAMVAEVVFRSPFYGWTYSPFWD